ncbi:MAG: alpha/beta hydrolase [Lautropia sp.]
MMETTAIAAGIAGGAYAMVSAALGHRFTRSARQAVACPRRRSPAHLVVEIPSRRDAVALSAWYIPSIGSRAAAILVHGRGSSKGFELEADTQPLVLALNDMGVSVLTIDLRGHGESATGRVSFGHHERLDVLGAVDWLLASGYERTRIAVIGASMGGAAALAAAAEEPAIGAVVTDCTFADFGRIARRHFHQALPLGAGNVLLPGTLLAARMLLGTFMHQFRPAEYAARLRGRPVMVIHTSGDPVIPLDHAFELQVAADARLWIIDDDAHVGGFRADPARYTARVCAFLSEPLLGERRRVAR